MIPVKVIPADHRRSIHIVQINESRKGICDLDDLQKLVGGYIEIVRPTPILNQQLFMVVNEEGLLRGLPYNSRASAFGDEIYSFFVGDVVITGAKNFRGASDLGAYPYAK